MPPKDGFLSSARLIAWLTLGSRVLGLMRECCFSYLFSASGLLSAFRIAFMVPNLARRLFGEGALSAALIPVLTKDIARNGPRSGRELLGAIIVLLVAVLSALVVFGEIVLLIWRQSAPDFALDLSMLLLPYMVLICVVAVISGALNVRSHFAAPAIAPMVVNVAIMAAALLAVWWGLEGQAIMYVVGVGVLAAGVTQLALVTVVMKRMDFMPILAVRWHDARVAAVRRMMGPMVLGLSAMQINALLDHLIAYVFVMHEGERVGPAVLGFAQYLYQLPLGVFGIALATAIFPVLSARAAANDRAGLAETFSRGVRVNLFVALPATAGLILVAQPLVATFFQHGAFDADDTRRVAGVLAYYSLGLPAYFTQHLVARTFYAIGDSKTPARAAMVVVGINLTLNLILVQRYEERGLALSTAICAALQVIWLGRRLSKQVPEVRWRSALGPVARMLVPTLVMIGVLMGMEQVGDHFGWIAQRDWLRLTMMVGLGMASYAAVARMMGIEELGDVLRRKLERTS